MTPFLAAPGWRVVVRDRENGGSMACPVVAWQPSSDPRYLDAFYLPNESEQTPRLVGQQDLMGFLAPGSDHESYWDELAVEAQRREEEAEERAFRNDTP